MLCGVSEKKNHCLPRMWWSLHISIIIIHFSHGTRFIGAILLSVWEQEHVVAEAYHLVFCGVLDYR